MQYTIIMHTNTVDQALQRALNTGAYLAALSPAVLASHLGARRAGACRPPAQSEPGVGLAGVHVVAQQVAVVEYLDEGLQGWGGAGMWGGDGVRAGG
mgnify:CR=1 FL=1